MRQTFLIAPHSDEGARMPAPDQRQTAEPWPTDAPDRPTVLRDWPGRTTALADRFLDRPCPTSRKTGSGINPALLKAAEIHKTFSLY